jgi:hypothetical protein
MNSSGSTRVSTPLGQLIAAAMVARDGAYTVRVVVPRASELVLQATEAAELAGVDVAVERMAAGATVHFVARHQDRRLAGGALHPRTLRPLVRSGSVVRTVPAIGQATAHLPKVRPAAESAPRSVDLLAFRRASEALALSQSEDTEALRIWDRLLRARAYAHVCGEVPTLVVDDVGGLVGLLRRRATERGVAVRVNPDACACS